MISALRDAIGRGLATTDGEGFVWSAAGGTAVRVREGVEQHLLVAVEREPGAPQWHRARLGAALRFPQIEDTLVAALPQKPSAMTLVGPTMGRWHPLRHRDDVKDVVTSMGREMEEALAWLADVSVERVERTFAPRESAHGLTPRHPGPHERYRFLVAAHAAGRDMAPLAAIARADVKAHGPAFWRAEVEALLRHLGV